MHGGEGRRREAVELWSRSGVSGAAVLVGAVAGTPSPPPPRLHSDLEQFTLGLPEHVEKGDGGRRGQRGGSAAADLDR